ncbi:alpha/beta hydrolase [Pelagicoccus mobilis]|uniref:Esterase family protein n=1 Tax=Pelagicoccus mobilis TaxID=415221 RepID=A0A934VPD2_9BACT|nr:alpha/beta hydrolase family protein [Pelagicoccus mobilis]MBK1875408.1 esterase family protein [Pelagicoccus mobilis]
MALMNFEFFSETLSLASEVNVVFSQRSKKQLGSDHKSPVLYLLHGLSDNHSAWLRKSSIERYAEEYDLTIVMPAVHRSFYRNTYSGYRYFDYVAHELPELCKTYLQISKSPSDTFVAGLSMGGYGAFKLALTHPEQYAAAASLSGALDLASLVHQKDELFPEWPHIFGPDQNVEASEDDLLHLASERKKEGVSLPKLYQCCGTEDYLYLANQSFLSHSQKIGLPLTYEEGPGEHVWSYWDVQIQKVLEWLPIRKLEKEGSSPDTDSKAPAS